MKAQILVKSIPKFKPADKPYEVTDNGLVLRIQPTGLATYYAVFRVNGKNSRYKIGKAGQFIKKDSGEYTFKPTIHPDVARTVLKEKAGEAAAGKDPQAERMQRRAEQKKSKSKTVGGFFEFEYLPWLLIERKSGKATGARLKSCFEWLFAKPMKDITPFLLKGWCNKRLEAGASPHTVNRDMVAIKAMLSKAVEWSFLNKNPLSGMEKSKTEDNERVRYLYPDEEKRLFDMLDKREAKGRATRTQYNVWRKERNLELLPEIGNDEFTDHLMPIVLLALNTGMRRGEIFGLMWGDIDFSNYLLTVRSITSKTKKRYIPLNINAHKVLKCWQKQTNDTGLVFPGEEGKRLDNIKTSWGNLIRDAAIDDFRFHDLRHDFATKTLKAGADIVTVSKLLGHKNLEMTMRYAHVTDDALVAAVEGLSVNR